MKKQLASALLAAAVLLQGNALAAAPQIINSSARRLPTPEKPLAFVSGVPAEDDDAALWDKTSGTIAFAQVEDAIRSGNPNLLSLEQNLARLDAFDRDKAYNDLLDAHNSLSDQIWNLITNPNPMISMQAQSLRQAQQSLQENLEALQKDKYALTYEDSRRAITDGMQQIVNIGETLYLQTLTLRQSHDDAKRGLAALDRQVTQAEKAYEIGALSQMELMNLHNSRAQAASQIDTLAYNIELCTLNLQTLLGAEPDGKLRLESLPAVTAMQLHALSPEADLARGLEANLAVYKAKRQVDDENDKLKDIKNEYSYEYKMQQHACQAAQHSYEAAIRNFQLKFKGLQNQLSEQERLVGVARQSLAVAEKNLSIAQLQYDRGQLSRMDFLAKKDAAADAESALSTAQNNLFATYQQYRWATRGLINSPA